MPEIEENIPDQELYKDYVLPDPVQYVIDAVRECSEGAAQFLMENLWSLNIVKNSMHWDEYHFVDDPPDAAQLIELFTWSMASKLSDTYTSQYWTDLHWQFHSDGTYMNITKRLEEEWYARD